ncbi:MAG: pyridoxamine 5'-phosphate oxidase family protein [Sphingomonas sp.]|jgi:hypothetical protein
MGHPPLTIWHEGEVALQRSVGLAERLHELGPRIIRDSMLGQHRAFFENLSFAVVGTLDEDAQPWAGVIASKSGLIRSPDDRTLLIARSRAEADPVERGMAAGLPIALLGIEPASQRRNRANGTIRRANTTGLTVHVEQSFGNCPQYITPRQLVAARADVQPQHSASSLLDGQARAFIARADTFFVASFASRDGDVVQVDVSHRGGPPGFVGVDAAGVLHIPDFAGNNYFNTLGNILTNSRAGLIFPDFHSGDVLQLTGEAQVFGVDRAAHPEFPHDRFWTVRPTEIIWRPGALSVTIIG